MRALHYVLVGIGYVFLGVAFLVAFVPGLFAFLFMGLADYVWKPTMVEPPRTVPDYESDWKLELNPDGSVSIYRNGSRYTTQTSLQSMKLSGADQAHRDSYFAVIPPELVEEMRSKLELADLLREWDRAVTSGSVSWMDRVAADMATIIEARTEGVMGPLERSLVSVLRKRTSA